MAYCDKCGAYIPDGSNRCFACGYDPEEEARAAAAAAQKKSGSVFGDVFGGSYYSFSNDELKQKLEQQRERQKEISRKWAEAERERRQAQKEQQAESYVNRPQQTQYTRSTAGTTRHSQEIEQRNRTLAALSYLSFLFILPFFICPEDQFAKFHAKQGLALFIAGVICDILGFIPLLGVVFFAFRIFCIVRGIKNVLAGKTEPLPLIGRFAL